MGLIPSAIIRTNAEKINITNVNRVDFNANTSIRSSYFFGFRMNPLTSANANISMPQKIR
jgi:hypothetical protein